MSCKGIFKFHNVGQGLFYTGEIRSYRGGNSFKFIYDGGSYCFGGTAKYAETKSVSWINKRVVWDEIDAIFVSYFHEDHINGIKEIIEKKRVKRIYLPYLSPVERLILVLGYYYLEKVPLEDFDFMLNPITYLLERGKVEEIILIRNDDNKNDERNINERGKIDLPDNEKLKKDLKNQYTDNNKLKYKDIGIMVKIVEECKWMFKIYLPKQSFEKIKEFQEKIDKLNVIDKDNIVVEKIQKTEMWKKLREIYENVFSKGKINETSMVLYHSPWLEDNYEVKITYKDYNLEKLMIRLVRDYLIREYDIFIEYFCKLISNTRREKLVPPGQLLTGDISLLQNKELWDYYNDEKYNIGIFQVPHHGSYKNWDRSVLLECMNSKYWIVPTGYCYGHPHGKLIKEILSCRRVPVIIDGDNSFGFSIDVFHT